MSTAHRPTWEPARGRGDTSHQSKMTSTRSLPSHTKLKFRQQGQEALVSGDDHGEESREALKARLARAEKEARNKKRKAEGLEPEPDSEAEEDEENEDEEGAFKKPRLPERIAGEAKEDDEEGVENDEDEDSDDDDADDAEIEARARAILKEQGFDGDDDDDDEDDDEDDDDEDDDEDETAQLMRELEKIKAEKAAAAAKKAEEEERERERREEVIATGNPLLNDGAGLSGGRGRSPSAMSTSTSATGQPSFGVKRRWDDDVIFKNQAAGSKQDKSDFINDMTRSDFHKEFMRRYIK